MNGFKDHDLDEDAFGEKSGNIVQAFDAFRKFSSLIYFRSTQLAPHSYSCECKR